MLLVCRSLPLLALAGALLAEPGLTLPRAGNSQKAAVTQYIGPVQVTIEYSSPAVRSPQGQDRRGQIWGKLVPYGLETENFGLAKPMPWRAGANENTVFSVSDDVLIEGQKLPAGRYGLHMIPGPQEWIVIFSKRSTAWGSYFYQESEDALRVKVKPKPHQYREWLTYEFTTRRPEEATAELQWDELAVPFTVKVENANEIYFSRLQRELTSEAGFTPEAWQSAAQFCLQAGIHLDEALKWADYAVSAPYVGRADFGTMSTKAQVLTKLGREEEAKALIDRALRLPGTTPTEIHQYGRQLLTQKKTDEAMKVFQYNAERNGDAWPVHVGLARGYAALGDKKAALEHAQKALPQAPDEPNKKGIQALIDSLK